jgi:hypothetical protein
MNLAVHRSHDVDPGGWLRQPSQTFVLTTVARFSAEELWVIHSHSLYHHVILDRTPHWYAGALRDALRKQQQAAQDDLAFEWPYWLPPSIPDEWVLTIARLIENPVYVITFRTASELAEFEPRLVMAFSAFKHFLDAYGSRPTTMHWRL